MTLGTMGTHEDDSNPNEEPEEPDVENRGGDLKLGELGDLQRTEK